MRPKPRRLSRSTRCCSLRDWRAYSASSSAQRIALRSRHLLLSGTLIALRLFELGFLVVMQAPYLLSSYLCFKRVQGWACVALDQVRGELAKYYCTPKRMLVYTFRREYLAKHFKSPISSSNGYVCYNSQVMRVSYSGYYPSFPNW